MEILTPKQLTGSRVYLADPINTVHSRLQLTKEALKAKIAIHSILNDKSLLPMDFIFGSYLTSQIFLEEPALLEKEVVIPTMIGGARSAEGHMKWVLGEKYETKREEFSMTGARYSQKTHLRLELFADNKKLTRKERIERANLVADLIDDNTRRAVAFDKRISIPAFRGSLLRSIDGLSARTSMFSAQNSLTHAIRDSFVQGSYFEPAWTEYVVKSCMRQVEQTVPRATRSRILSELQDVVEMSYFIAGSTTLGASIGCDSQYVPIAMDFFKTSMDLSPVKEETFRQALELYGSGVSHLAVLDADSLSRLKRHFISTRLSTRIEKILKGSAARLSAEEIRKDLGEAIAAEISLKRVPKLTRGLMKVLLYTTSILSVADLVTDPLVRYLWSRYGPCEFTFFFSELLPREISKSAERRILTSFQ